MRAAARGRRMGVVFPIGTHELHFSGDGVWILDMSCPPWRKGAVQVVSESFSFVQEFREDASFVGTRGIGASVPFSDRDGIHWLGVSSFL